MPDPELLDNIVYRDISNNRNAFFFFLLLFNFENAVVKLLACRVSLISMFCLDDGNAD